MWKNKKFYSYSTALLLLLEEKEIETGVCQIKN
jgi:hypothetical protein